MGLISAVTKSSTSSLAPQQGRSRESLRKLLKAAAEVVGQHGLENATIPRIASHAGLTPGAVYRRFRDKDALMEAVILGVLERQDERLQNSLAPASAKRIPLAVFAEQIIGSMVISYRANASLLRAMRIFVQGRTHTPFWRKACRCEIKTFERIVDLFLCRAALGKDVLDALLVGGGEPDAEADERAGAAVGNEPPPDLHVSTLRRP